ncbi:glutamate 5-kinase [Gordonia sp. 'Campus']|uniref:glutamate 5-kinase n=1 Tax=Gordonia sp. 'Campus' TaxID=2915824 RepID=UPI001EE47BAD|nr:glutamate 5-kinase [Gordonia sp. 'Campus']
MSAGAAAGTSPRGSVRDQIASARSIVVKIGSSALTDLADGLDRDRLDALADALESRMRTGSDVIVVSSGAIGAGIAPLGLRKRPTDLATKQAAASVGQLALAHAWGTSFGRYGRTVGQVLLTADDISNRSHHANAQRTLDRLRSLGAVAVVNENDTVATNEIRFGDNDRLAALVAHLSGADALVLLSDVDGLYDGDPRKVGIDGRRARLIPEVHGPEDLDGVIAGSGGALGTGGMASKLAAARLSADAGVPVLLAAASSAAQALADASVGTVFAARPERLSARRFWVRHAADARGRIILDDGAVAAVSQRRRSLLAAGIVGVEGRFFEGDVVELVDRHGAVRARGVAAYGVDDVTSMVGRSTSALPPELQRPVVHADDLVVVAR